MKLWGVPMDALQTIVCAVSDELFEGNVRFKKLAEHGKRVKFIMFTLTVLSSRGPGSYRAPSGRRVKALTWRDHGVFMAAIFDRFPDATLQSACAMYRGRADFEKAVAQRKKV